MSWTRTVYQGGREQITIEGVDGHPDLRLDTLSKDTLGVGTGLRAITIINRSDLEGAVKTATRTEEEDGLLERVLAVLQELEDLGKTRLGPDEDAEVRKNRNGAYRNAARKLARAVEGEPVDLPTAVGSGVKVTPRHPRAASLGQIIEARRFSDHRWHLSTGRSLPESLLRTEYKIVEVLR